MNERKGVSCVRGMNAMSIIEIAVKMLKMPIQWYALHGLKNACKAVMISTRHSLPKKFKV